MTTDQHPYFCQTHGLTRNGECLLCKRDAQASNQHLNGLLERLHGPWLPESVARDRKQAAAAIEQLQRQLREMTERKDAVNETLAKVVGERNELRAAWLGIFGERDPDNAAQWVADLLHNQRPAGETPADPLLLDVFQLLGRLGECFADDETEFADICEMRNRLARPAGLGQPPCPKCGCGVMSSTWRCTKCGTDIEPVSQVKTREKPSLDLAGIKERHERARKVRDACAPDAIPADMCHSGWFVKAHDDRAALLAYVAAPDVTCEHGVKVGTTCLKCDSMESKHSPRSRE